MRGDCEIRGTLVAELSSLGDVVITVSASKTPTDVPVVNLYRTAAGQRRRWVASVSPTKARCFAAALKAAAGLSETAEPPNPNGASKSAQQGAQAPETRT